MGIQKKREKVVLSEAMASLIKHLSGLDRTSFDRRAAKYLQPFFGDTKIAWTPAPAIKGQGPARLRDALKICDNEGNIVAFVAPSTTKKSMASFGNFKCPDEWPLVEQIISGLYISAIKLSEAKELAFIDDVTQLFNQRYLELVLDREIRRAERSNLDLSALFIDIDHFKSVNDTNGHLVGSQLLCQISTILKQNIRMIDYGFRYGGDEFILLLVGTKKESAISVGERIRSQVENTEFSVDGKSVRLTLSIGVASFPEHAKNKKDIVKIADEAMYLGKNKSRNIVSVAS